MNIISKKRTKASHELPKLGEIHQSIKANFERLIKLSHLKDEVEEQPKLKAKNLRKYSDRNRVHNHSVQIHDIQK